MAHRPGGEAEAVGSAPATMVSPAADVPSPITCDVSSLEMRGVLTAAPGLLTFTLASHATTELLVRLSSTLGDAVIFQEWNENLGHPPTAAALEVGPTDPSGDRLVGGAVVAVGGWSGGGGDGEGPEDACALFHEIGQIESVVMAPGERRAVVLVFRPAYVQACAPCLSPVPAACLGCRPAQPPWPTRPSPLAGGGGGGRDERRKRVGGGGGRLVHPERRLNSHRRLHSQRVGRERLAGHGWGRRARATPEVVFDHTYRWDGGRLCCEYARWGSPGEDRGGGRRGRWGQSARVCPASSAVARTQLSLSAAVRSARAAFRQLRGGRACAQGLHAVELLRGVDLRSAAHALAP